MELAKKECIPCQGGIPPLSEIEIPPLLNQLRQDWQVVENHHLTKEYRFKNFKQSMEVANLFGDVAEAVGHHPDLLISFSLLCVTIHTHKIDGLSVSDFILAAKLEEQLAHWHEISLMEVPG